MEDEIPTKKPILRCPVCDTPMASLKNLNIFVRKNMKGNSENNVRIEILPVGPVTQFKIHCPKLGCKGAHIFVKVEENIGMKENFTIRKESVDKPVDDKNT